MGFQCWSLPVFRRSVELFGRRDFPGQRQCHIEEEFMNQLQTEQGTQFQNEQVAQNQLQQAWSPIVAGGAYQYGFSTAEDQQLQGNIENAGAQATENTENAAQLRQQQATGGAGGGPAGGQAAIDAQVAATGAQQTATNLAQEKEAGYQTGRQNFLAATGGEAEVAGLSSPTSYAGAATKAGTSATGAINLVDQNNANSLVNKAVGGAAQGAFGALGTVASTIGSGNVGW